MRKLFILLLVVLFVQEETFGNPGFVFNKITTNNGLSHSTVFSITQDHKGFIWIGTREGLNRYDSYGIKAYYADPEVSHSLSSNQIVSLLSGSEEGLYIGTAAGLNIYDYQKDLMREVRLNGEGLGFVHQLYEASDQRIYICSSKGLFALDKQGEVTPLIEGKGVFAISEYKRNKFWLATRQQVLLTDQTGEVIKYYPYLYQAENQFLSTVNNVSCIFKDGSGDVWVGTRQNGVYRYIAGKDTFEPIIPTHKDNPIEVNMVRAISEDGKGNLWIGTESGLFIYDKRRKKFSHYTQSFETSSNGLSDKAIYCIYRSTENIMWLGTYFGGLNFVKPNENGFKKLVPDGGKKSLSGKAISQIIEDGQGNLLIGTEDGGINILNREQDSFDYLTHRVHDKNSLSSNNVHAIHSDGEGSIWIGTFLGGLNRYHVNEQKFSLYKKKPEDTLSLSNNSVYAVLKDSRGVLWVGTQNGLNIYHEENDSFLHFKPELFSGKFIYDILEDYQGNLWFCTRSSGIFFYNVKEDFIRAYNKNNEAGGLPSSSIICAYQDSKERIWFGSLNGGLICWDSTQQRFTAITQKDGLPNNTIYGILEDEQGNLWLSSNKGLSRYNPETQEVYRFNVSHGIVDSQFNFKSFFKDKEGWMYFGTVNGLYFFHPDSITFNTVAPKVHFTDFKLFNKSLKVQKQSVLASHIDEAKEIELEYAQNVLTFEFVATNFFSPGNNTFSYYLEGFEDGWNHAGSKRTATYTNLSPGTYTFHIKAANNDGVWSDEKQIKLSILSPFWMTNWAIVIYALLGVALVYLYWLYMSYRQQEKMALQLERVEKEKMEELNQHKLNFFTYISHEFKTPLTLIIASIDRFLNKETDITESKPEYHLIKRNAKRLHFLIEQLMEFRKTETDHAILNQSRGDVVLFLQDTFTAFIPLFAKKNIDYHITSDHERYLTYFDADKLEKILANLLSNAIKNTREYGEISMGIRILPSQNKEEQPEGLLQIQLTDSGIGLFEGEADKVFMPFYQAKQEHVKTTGSGIGLALVNSLVKFLSGNIQIESTVKKGTTITINLPLSEGPVEKINPPKEIEGNKSLLVDHDLFHEEDDLKKEELQAGEVENDFELMVVEDNPELLKFMVSHFSRFYKVSYAKNGEAALERLQKSVPDAIISDVIMPKVDGLTLCKKVKENINTSHIPFILLTAKSTVSSKLEGLDVGANAYLPKPFNLKELELMVKNMLESRNSLKKHFLQFGSIESYDKPVNNKDQEFLNQLTRVVNEHLDDSDFNVTSLTREAGISRTLLHMKLKKLVNLSSSDFIKTIRLQKASKLLKEGLSVAEVAFMVGYKDPNYFSRSFKEKFGVTPSEYKLADYEPQ
jgi:ligand-binding sensor domain-containing protein/signal transduction histidine kinase/DNA-binding response OmpR family regulator